MSAATCQTTAEQLGQLGRITAPVRRKFDRSITVESLTLWNLQDAHADVLAEYVGGLSAPSKMPCPSYNLPAQECRVGSRLRQVEGSTCSGCYAMKGRYLFGNVRAALYRRLATLGRELWAPVMAELISRKTSDYFRWHDSGDLQSAAHLAAIVEVCELTPHIRHWLPTREYRLVADYVSSGGVIPANLTIRMSAHMVGGKVPTFPSLPVTVSTVSHSGAEYADAHACPSRFQAGKCGDCRACWDRGQAHVDYHIH